MSAFCNIGPTIISAFGGFQQLTLQRRASGSYGTDGVWIPGALTTSLIDAAVQPAGAHDSNHFREGHDVRQRPEGERASEAISIFTTVELRTSDISTGIDGDLVIWQGRTFKVLHVENWIAQSGHCRAIATRIAP